jgi:hypothetical protein
MKHLNDSHQTLNRYLNESENLIHSRVSTSCQKLLSSAKPLQWMELRMRLKDHPEEIIEILTQVLPLRQSVYWALVCGQALPDFGLESKTASETVLNTLKWTIRPDDTIRKSVGELARQLCWKSPEYLLATAVNWSSGSILPPQVPIHLPAPNGVTGHFVAGAIFTIAARLNVVHYNLVLNQMINIAEEIAIGRLLPTGWNLSDLASESAKDIGLFEFPGIPMSQIKLL